ncbi:MAG: CocE/NonD family hydrolase [Actinomycetota bacterium]|nr:CocE/NonD family hydrolase [Actinomycetota bacterium]
MPTSDVFIEMRDGVRLAATLYLPEKDGPWPALLEALPYRKDDVTAHYRGEYERLAGEFGFAVARVDVRGTGSSDGLATDEYPHEEQKDLCEVIEWLAAQEWSSGAVGMFGTSYSGFNSIQVAMEQPPALKAIIPIFATDDRYMDDVHYFGGAFKALDTIDYPLYMLAMNALPPVPSLIGDDWRERWRERVEQNEPWLLTWLEEQTDGPYWHHGSLYTDYGSIKAATMIVGGWADGYTNNSLRTMERLTCPKRLLLGPWAHASTATSLPGPRIDLVPEMVRWWDRWLRGTPNGIDEEPPILFFARRSTKPAADLEEMRGEWRFEPGWPLDRMRERNYELRDATSLVVAEDGADTLFVRGDVGWTGWISCAGHLPFGQPIDQRPDEAFSLVYDWGPLEDELEILGHARVEITLRSTAPVAYLSAKVCDVFADGTSALVARGLLNLTQRESRSDPSPLEPSTEYRIALELEVTSWTFESGHRIRLDLAGSDWPNAWSPPMPVDISFRRADAALVLPVLEGPSPVHERPSFPPVDPKELGKTGSDVDLAARKDIVWRIDHDVMRSRTSAEIDHGGDPYEASPGTRVHEHYAGVIDVSTKDPGDASATGVGAFAIGWGDIKVRSESRVNLRSDRDAYHIELELEVHENDQLVGRRSWKRSIERRLQ